jgi:hypothetical protein
MRKGTRKVRVLLAPVYTIIFEIGQLFGGECEVCLKKMRKPMPGFTVHHLKYKFGEKIHSDFATRLDYYMFLLPIVTKHKSRFAFLCNKCHHSLDGPRGLNRRKKENVLRLITMWKMGQKGKS